MDPENSVSDGVGIDKVLFSRQGISQRAVRTSFEKQLNPRGVIASRGGSVPVFLGNL